LLDVVFYVFEDRVECFVLTSRRQDVETLNEGKAGVDHRGELTGEDDQLFGRDASSERQAELPSLLLDFDRIELSRTQPGLHGFFAVRLDDSCLNFARASARFVYPLGHEFSARSPPGLSKS
jgi:hypothetical protein